jgi:hypothetical protein
MEGIVGHHIVVVKESELYVILRKLDSKKIKGDVRVYTEPIRLHDSVTDMPTSQVCVRHVFVLTADRLTDLAGRLLLHVHPTISMTLPRDEACMLVRTQD